MITAERLKQLTTLDHKGLARVLDRSGYSMCSFESAKFLGLTNSGQFCYSVTYYDDGGGPIEGPATSKVFVAYDAATDGITADF